SCRTSEAPLRSMVSRSMTSTLLDPSPTKVGLSSAPGSMHPLSIQELLELCGSTPLDGCPVDYDHLTLAVSDHPMAPNALFRVRAGQDASFLEDPGLGFLRLFDCFWFGL